MKKSIQLKIKDVFLKLVFVVFYLVFLNCKAQQIKTFDIETFEKHKDHLNNYTFITNDSTVIEQRKQQYGYYEIIKPKNSYFHTRNAYYENGNLKSTVQDFPNDFLAGVMKEYDEQGNLIKETDYDKPYKFTWKDILAFIKERKFDMNAYGFWVSRSFGYGTENIGKKTEKPFWAITYHKSKKDMLLGVVIIDGITGKIINEYDQDYPGED